MAPFRAARSAALALAIGAAAAPTAPAEETPEFGVLKVAHGVETTYYTCSGCHSERIIAQQGLTRAGWDDLLDWMIEEQGMPELDAADRDEILDYLAAHYNEDRPNFPVSATN
ncbi:MAG: aldehyde dehydrogenase [Pseudomonadota bacterium]